MPKAIWMGAVLFATVSCAHVQPESQSAEAHRADAAHERAEADAQRSQYDPKQTGGPVAVVGPGGAFAVTVETPPDNPTAWHLRKAAQLSEHARAHEAAAAQLQSFEADECRGVSANARAACPFMGPIAGIVDIDGGVRFVLSDHTQVGAVIAQMRCHFAWARARGFTRVGDCPIYLKGIDINRSADGLGIDITGHERGVVTALRQNAHGG